MILILGAITVYMGSRIKDIEWSFDFAKLVPPEDPDMIYFEEFKQLFGEDGNIMALGIKDSALYTPEALKNYKYLTDEIASLKGVTNVLSLINLPVLEKDTKNKRFNMYPLFDEVPEDKETLDSLLQKALDLKFYSGQIINENNGATVMLVTIDKEVLNSKKREGLAFDIEFAGNAFFEQTGIKIRYAGLPYVRSVVSGRVAKELEIFLILSALITGLVMLILFRSWDAVLFPMIIIAVLVIWSMGTLAILGYKITILTGLLPPIIVVIGIPNSVYLLNKYHQEFNTHGNKMWALSRMIRKIGFVALITNTTTAIGFLVLGFTDITLLKEFGVVASINILATFIVSIVLIPAVFSYLPEPNTRQLKHLHFKPLEFAIEKFDIVVHRYHYWVFGVTALIVAVSFFGISKLYSVSFIVDDIPKDSQVKKDLEFFEENFSGIMPLELVVDTKKRRGVLNLRNMRQIEELENYLSEHQYISKPVSVVSFMKASRQAFYNNNPDLYGLPSNSEKNFILRYMRNNADSSGILNSFVDSTAQTMRVSFKVADVGSKKLDSLVTKFVQPKIDSLFQDSDVEVAVTGTTLLFVKGNKFLVENLQMSLVLAFMIISVIMGALFRNFKMIIISLIPNFVPLIITAGLMGFLGVPLKPSTALIFSIAFGISVDDSIHFLAKYRMELFANRFNVPIALSKTLRETGASMIYTSIILFFGFVIFAASDFLATVALGALTSVTLLIAMFTNLIFLPSLLIRFDSGKRNVNAHPWIEQIDDFYDEDEDETSDPQKMTLENSGSSSAG
ncbi:MAG: MMPL family transporter [Bacteroidota bacterium]